MSKTKFFAVLGSVLVLAVIVFFSVFSVKFIDAGYTGVKINLYGNEKGVQNVTAVTGMCIYNHFTQKVIKTPTYVQNSVWTADVREGSPTNQEFSLTTKKGLSINLDVALNWSVSRDNAAKMYMKYRKPYDEVAKTILRNYTRDAYNRAASQYTVQQIFDNRDAFLALADKYTREDLEEEGFTIEKDMVINKIRPPESVTTAINLKINAEQTALRKVQEQAQERADSIKRIIRAGGIADSIRIRADAIAYSNKVISASLTPEIVQTNYIDRWNGSFGTGNMFGQGALLYKQIGK